MKPEDKAPELPDSIVTSPAYDDTPAATSPADEPAPQVTLLAGMKVLFDEKVGLAPVQVVDHDRKLHDKEIRKANGRANGHAQSYARGRR